jgi:hypothetical protein
MLAATNCPPGQSYNPLTQQCEIVIDGDTLHPCPKGQHTDPVSYACTADAGAIQASMGPIGWSALAGAVLIAAGAIWKRFHGEAAPAAAPGRRRR